MAHNEAASGDFHPCVWAITLNEWFDAMLRYRTRDYDSEEVVPAPDVTAQVIRETSERMRIPPLLWIEEMDKVRFTDTNRNWLHTLINSVYELDGCIVATTNSTLAELRQSLGEGIVSRLDGSRDGEEGFVCLDFSPPPAKAVKRKLAA